MTLKARTNCVIVRPDIEKHALFALLRDKRTGTGVITAVGPDTLELTVGTRVLFGDNIGQDFEWQTESMLVMREEHVLGVLDD